MSLLYLTIFRLVIRGFAAKRAMKKLVYECIDINFTTETEPIDQEFIVTLEFQDTKISNLGKADIRRRLASKRITSCQSLGELTVHSRERTSRDFIVMAGTLVWVRCSLTTQSNGLTVYLQRLATYHPPLDMLTGKIDLRDRSWM